VYKKTPLFEEAVATASVPLLEKQTFYVTYGHLFEKFCLGLLALCAGWRTYAAYSGKRSK
jgi:apolipoprotein N-acyltransferase